jgi:SAM-dependent methyltransferase
MSFRATDWDRYYQGSAFTSRFTRPITTKRLLDAFERYSPQHPVIVELGGANSCVYDAIVERMQPAHYHVVDNNRLGLDLLRRRVGGAAVSLHCANVLQFDLKLQVDVVFSIGLIEHFDQAGTRQVIQAHFDLLKPGGIAIITFPTPTWLYRGTRGLAELTGQWAFPDERPLDPEEVAATARTFGEILHQEIIWPIFLTQTLMVIRKR